MNIFEKIAAVIAGVAIYQWLKHMWKTSQK